MLRRDVGQTTAILAVGSAIFTSSIAYYLTVQPLMVHGLTFGLACLVIVTTRRAVETDRASDWRLAGALIGLITACRFQAFVLFVLVLIVPIGSFKSAIRRVALVVPPLLLMVVPQLVVWFHMFGTPFAIPQGPGFMTWQPTHWLDTLISADRGLFNWHPVLLIGLCGLFLARPLLRRLSIGGLVAFGLTVWTNGQLSDFAGSDSFGSRRYDLIIPFFAIGMARLFAASRPFLIQRPLALPSLLIVGAALWNASFAQLYGAQRFRQAAPLDELAQAQTERLHEGARSLLGPLGPRMRFRVYDAFVGLYAYRNYRLGGDFDLASLEPRFLGRGWSDPQWWDDGQTFRYVLYPKGCLFIPIEEAFDLRGFVLARSPARIRNQRVTLTLNGRALVELPLPPAWTELPFQAPKAYWQAGLNEFCIVAKEKRPGDESGDLAYAAGIVRVQLP